MAWRLSMELVVSVSVGGALGFGIDHLTGASPFGMLVGIGFGFAAGVRGVMRAALEMQAQGGQAASAPDEKDT